MTAPCVIGRKADSVGWVAFSNLARHNALTSAMCAQLAEILADFDADPEVRLCVMTGDGDKAFVSGADIEGLPADGKRREGGGLLPAFTALQDFQKPMLAMIRGWCLGGGMAVALKADLRFCATDAQFGIPAARLGVGYSLELTRDLVAVAGPSAAKRILFTGARLPAAEALRLGLVDEVLAPEALEDRVVEIARTIAANAPLSLMTAKAAVDHVASGAGRPEDIAAMVAQCFQSADFKEGRTAFLEKRAPVFRGA